MYETLFFSVTNQFSCMNADRRQGEGQGLDDEENHPNLVWVRRPRPKKCSQMYIMQKYFYLLQCVKSSLLDSKFASRWFMKMIWWLSGFSGETLTERSQVQFPVVAFKFWRNVFKDRQYSLPPPHSWKTWRWKLPFLMKPFLKFDETAHKDMKQNSTVSCMN